MNKSVRVLAQEEKLPDKVAELIGSTQDFIFMSGFQ